MTQPMHSIARLAEISEAILQREGIVQERRSPRVMSQGPYGKEPTSAPMPKDYKDLSRDQAELVLAAMAAWEAKPYNRRPPAWWSDGRESATQAAITALGGKLPKFLKRKGLSGQNKLKKQLQRAGRMVGGRAESEETPTMNQKALTTLLTGRSRSTYANIAEGNPDGSAVTYGHNRYAQGMDPATKDKVLQARVQEIEEFARDRGLDLPVVFGVAEATLRTGRVPELGMYGLAGDDAMAVKHFMASALMNIAGMEALNWDGTPIQESPEEAVDLARGSRPSAGSDMDEAALRQPRKVRAPNVDPQSKKPGHSRAMTREQPGAGYGTAGRAAGRRGASRHDDPSYAVARSRQATKASRYREDDGMTEAQRALAAYRGVLPEEGSSFTVSERPASRSFGDTPNPEAPADPGEPYVQGRISAKTATKLNKDTDAVKTTDLTTAQLRRLARERGELGTEGVDPTPEEILQIGDGDHRGGQWPQVGRALDSMLSMTGPLRRGGSWGFNGRLGEDDDTQVEHDYHSLARSLGGGFDDYDASGKGVYSFGNEAQARQFADRVGGSVKGNTVTVSEKLTVKDEQDQSRFVQFGGRGLARMSQIRATPVQIEAEKVNGYRAVFTDKTIEARTEAEFLRKLKPLGITKTGEHKHRGLAGSAIPEGVPKLSGMNGPMKGRNGFARYESPKAYAMLSQSVQDESGHIGYGGNFRGGPVGGGRGSEAPPTDDEKKPKKPMKIKEDLEQFQANQAVLSESAGRTIFNQLKKMRINGFPLLAYLGAKKISVGNDDFRAWMGGKWKGYVVIEYNRGTDLYDLTFFRIRKYEHIIDCKVLGVEVGNLPLVLQRYVEYGEAKGKKGREIRA